MSEAQTQFAPGPWSAVANSWQHMTVYDANQMPVCRLDLDDWGVHEDNQQALQLLHDDIAEYARINNLGGFDNHCMRLARAAINKATGAA